MSTSFVGEGFAILLLILLNGFFALAEMSLVTSRKPRLEAEAARGNRGAAVALRLLETPDSLFSTVQIGITLIGILTGAFGGASVAAHLTHVLADMPAVAPYAASLAFGVVIIVTTYLTLIFGELVPKKMAFASPERFACAVAPVMLVFMRLSMPAVWLLSLSSRAASTILRIREDGPSVTDEDIRGMLAEGVRSGVVLDAERTMSERVMRLGDRSVTSIMTHRTRVAGLDSEAPQEDIIERLAASTYSRFPVCDGDLDNVLGVIKAREYLAACAEGADVTLKNFMRQPVFIPETARALDLLEAFRTTPHVHFAMVVGEYGEVQGIVTLNDVLEAIVGDIPSPDEADEPEAVRRADGSWLLDGMMHIDDMADVTGLRLPDEKHGDFETLAGLLLQHLGKLPAIGDTLRLGPLHFEIVDMDGRRIDRVLLSTAATLKEEYAPGTDTAAQKSATDASPPKGGSNPAA